MENLENQNLSNIIDQAKHGDQEAFSYLYTNYFTPVYRYLYLRTGSKADSEDMVQDVFIKAYVSFERYSYQGTSPLAYFYTIARNTLIDHRRKKKAPVLDEDQLMEIADPANNPEENLLKEHAAEDLHKKLNLLPEDQQEVIILKFINELSTKEIADALEKSEESVRQLQSRGLKALRNIFNSHE